MNFSFVRRAAFAGISLSVLSGAASLAPPAFAQQQEQRADAVVSSSSDLNAVIVSARGQEINLSVGSQDGVLPGAVYAVEHDGKVSARLRVTAVRETESRAILLDEDGKIAIGDTARLLSVGTAAAGKVPDVPLPLPLDTTAASTRQPLASSPTERSPENVATQSNVPQDNAPKPAQVEPQTGGHATDSGNASGNASAETTKSQSVAAQANAGFALVSEKPDEETATPQHRNSALDYAAVALITVLAARADASPSSTFARAVIGTDQFSVISPFPGGGFTIRSDGIIAPGGAMQVNIPLAYAPRRFSSAIGIFAAQSRPGRNIFGSEIDRNGTVNLGLGFGVKNRGVWLSRMILSAVGFSIGGDSAYNALLQVVSETKSVPAIAVGIQDITNKLERSPFVVATKQMSSRRPLYLSLGIGAGRFAGSRVFGGVSYAPAKRLSLSAEYDGIQFNIGSVFALSKHLSILVSANDLAQSSNRPGVVLGRRFQLGTTYSF